MMNSLTNTKLFEDHLRHSQLVLTVQSNVTERGELHLTQLMTYHEENSPYHIKQNFRNVMLNFKPGEYTRLRRLVGAKASKQSS